MELGGSVDSCRRALLVFAAGNVVWLLAENVVGGDVYERAVAGLDGFGKVADGGSVEQFGKVGIILRFVDVGVGGAVDNDVYVVVGHRFFHSVGIGYVELGDIGKYVVVVGAFRGIAQAISELAVGSCYEYVHFSYWSLS